MLKIARFICMSLLLTAQVHASAALIYQQPPAAVQYGVQADASTGAFSQSFALGGAIVERVTWWGFHGVNSMGPDADLFEVYLDGALMQGTLTTLQEGALTKHVLELTTAALNPVELSVWNNSVDVEWFWQSIAAGNDTMTAFTLDGVLPVAEVAEAGMIPLVALALLSCVAVRRAAGKQMRTRAPRIV